MRVASAHMEEWPAGHDIFHSGMPIRELIGRPLSKRKTTCLRVAVALPVKEPFSYAVPEPFESGSLVGCRVTVPFGRRKVSGFVLGEEEARPEQPLRPILDVPEGEPLFHAGIVPFLEWVASYYLHPIGLLIQSIVPGGGGGVSFHAARLTERGRAVLCDLPTRSVERRLLGWVRDHPGIRCPFPLRDLRQMRSRGLITLETGRSAVRRDGPRMQRFVRSCGEWEIESLREKRSESLGARHERDFLAMVVAAGPVRLRDVKKRFDNGDYLVRKWVRKGVIETYDAPMPASPTGRTSFPSPEPAGLFAQQESVLKEIRGLLRNGAFSTCLIHGVTGSGKTEVYYQAVLETIRTGKQALVLVPEISLAVYMDGVFRSRLGERVALYHSELSNGERYNQWVRMARGEVDVVIGARSAVFAPLPLPGLIVVDEEHDVAYKQEEAPRYQARDAAVVRGKMEKALVLLGSGTPSVQSFYNASTGKYRMLTMPERVEQRPMPTVEILDMREAGSAWGKDGAISPLLKDALRENLDRGNQALLFLNRRGFHRVCLCRSCGESVRCPHCDLALIHHLKDDVLACHYCGYRTRPGGPCKACGRGEIRALGFGTERIESELANLFPDAEIGRMDRDSTRRKGTALSLLKRFEEGGIDILVGTQMITKGYDFPKVTLVGVIAADASLGFPDFRAAERTFQLLCQVAGRSGRGDQPGRVLVQTYNPSHYAVATARLHDYTSFFHQETALRAELGYPPFGHLARMCIQGPRKDETEKTARRLGRHMGGILREGRAEPGRAVQVLGPVEAPIARIKGKYRWQVLVKSPGVEPLHRFLGRVEPLVDRLTRGTAVTVVLDVDPYQML